MILYFSPLGLISIVGIHSPRFIIVYNGKLLTMCRNSNVDFILYLDRYRYFI